METLELQNELGQPPPQVKDWPEVKSGQINYDFRTKSPGEAGIMETVELMQEIKDEYRHKPFIIELARQIIDSVKHNPRTDHAQEIYKWLDQRVGFVFDPHKMEQLQTPEVTDHLGTGDCDDYSIYAASLLESIGLPTKYRVVSYRPDGKLSHIYPIVKIEGVWYAFDVAGKQSLGWEKGGITRNVDI